MSDISVIIPTFARPERLHECLEALCLISGVPFEVVVIDDGSPEPATEVTDKFEDRLSIKCLRQENAGPAAARNRGAQVAGSSLLAFTDDDCRPEAGWLDALHSALQKSPDALVGGQTFNVVEDNIYSETSQDLVSFLYAYAERKGADYDFFTSNNMACRADKFIELGGFDESFPLAAGEDRDFGLRWKAAGWPLIHEPRAVMRHAHHLDLKKFWRQQSNYGRGARHMRGRIEDRGGDKVRFEGLNFYLSMANYPFREGRSRPLGRLALLGLSQIATVSGFVAEALKRPEEKDARHV